MPCTAKTFKCLVYQRYIGQGNNRYKGELCTGCMFWSNGQPETELKLPAPVQLCLPELGISHSKTTARAWQRFVRATSAKKRLRAPLDNERSVKLTGPTGRGSRSEHEDV